VKRSVAARLGAVGRRVRGLFGPRALILLYHRIADESSDPFRLCVSPRNFEEHLQAIRRVGRPLSLVALARAVVDRRVPQGAVCVTFDDGYHDNLVNAAPLLQRHDVPATCFVTTGSMGRDREFWWDELQRILLGGEGLPGHLGIDVGATRVDIDLRDANARNGDAAPPAATGRMSRHEALLALHGHMQPLPETSRNEVLDRLHEWAGLTRAVRQSHRAMHPDELMTLERAAPIEIGAHTVSHPLLPAHAADVQREEIATSRTTLQEWLGHAVAGFAYPYGAWTETSVEAVRDAGFDYACSCIWGGVRMDSGQHLLPRVEAADCSGDVFEAFLRKYLRQ
jgi:peptidoglycan/xylan/chitin deacetylase (PgdA/CDA1 family)